MSAQNRLKNKPRLGRGLSSLISFSDLPVQREVTNASQSDEPTSQAPLPPSPNVPSGPQSPGSGTVPGELPVDSILPNPHQPRKNFDDAALAELAASIRSTGLIHPLVVRRVADRYELITGERRLRAAKMAGLKTVPVLVRNVDALTQAQMALIENIQRADLNPLERAQGYRTLLNELGLTQAELAGRIGEDRSTIANFLRLLELCEPVQTMVRDGRLSVGHAKILAGIADPAEQERLANLTLIQGLSVRNLERIVQRGVKQPPAGQPGPAASAHIQDLEKTISRQLGLRVQIRPSSKKGRGRIVIYYGSLDQFDGLLQRLGVRLE